MAQAFWIIELLLYKKMPKRKFGKVYNNYNFEKEKQNVGEKCIRIECKRCKQYIVKHSTQMLRHSAVCKDELVQPTIKQFEEFVKVIVANNLPFSIVQSSSFKRFCRCLNKDIVMPSVKNVKKLIKEEGMKWINSIDKQDRFTLILDEWKNCMGKSIINLPVKQKFIFLDSVEMCNSHTTENMVEDR